MAHYAPYWQNITSNQEVLSVIKRGYRIPFKEPPFQRTQYSSTNHKDQNWKKRSTTSFKRSSGGNDSGIPKILLQNLSSPKKEWKTKAYYRPFHSEQKHSNSRLQNGDSEIRNSIQQNNWAFSLDLIDPNLHILIYPTSHKYLRFTLKDKILQFRALLFGLSTSPFVFTQLMLYIFTQKLFPYFHI